VHVHPVYLDDMGGLSVTAAHGGITTLIHFASTLPGRGLVETLQGFRDEGEAKSVVDFALHGAMFDPASQASEIPDAVQEGVTSFKMFMAYAKLNWMTDDYQLMRTLDIIASAGGMGMVHAANGPASDYLEDKYRDEGRDAREVFEQTSPGILEAEAVTRVGAMAQVAACPLYIPHVSAWQSAEALQRLRAAGQVVYGEACPQYLALTDEEVRRQGALAKIGPPLRGDVDRCALWRALARGGLDTVGSDHAPKEKRPDDPFAEAPYGSPQVETMPALVYQLGVVEGRIPLPRMVQVMCENPARIFGLYPQKGTLQPGSDADLVVWEPTAERTIRQATQHSRAPYTLYEGWSVLGRPALVVQRGRTIVQDDVLVATAGQGAFLRTRAGRAPLHELMPKGGPCPQA